MNKQPRLNIRLALIGLAVATVLFTYLEVTNYASLNSILRAVAILLCPPSLLSVLFIDVEPRTSDFAAVWLAIGVVNAALYAAIGLAVTWLRKKASEAVSRENST